MKPIFKNDNKKSRNHVGFGILLDLYYKKDVAANIFIFIQIKKSLNATCVQTQSGADEGTWTHMRLLSLEPESSASADSATSAYLILSPKLELLSYYITAVLFCQGFLEKKLNFLSFLQLLFFRQYVIIN